MSESLRQSLQWQPQAPLQLLDFDWLQKASVEVAVLRLDLVDPLISGNKWFKLVSHLHTAANAGAQGLISLGGSHSNLLHALAAAGHRFGFPTVGLVRGHPRQTPTVADLQAWGMQLHWLGHGDYRARHRADFWHSWQTLYPHLHAVPEGGGGLAGARGCMPLVAYVQTQLAELGWADYHGWWLAAGTGTTLAGLALAEDDRHLVYGAMAVPASYGVEEHIRRILQAANDSDTGSFAAHTGRNYRLVESVRGGFAKPDAQLLEFMHACEAQTRMPIEPVYTGKALMALREYVDAGRFAPGTRLIFVHTGGLQGRRAQPSSAQKS